MPEIGARGADANARARRGILAGVVDEDVDGFGHRRRIDRDVRQIGIDLDPDNVIARDRVGAHQAGADDLVNRCHAEPRQRRRVGLVGRGQPLDEAVQAIRFLIDHLEQLAAALVGQLGHAELARPEHRRHGRLNRRERRAEIVGQRVEQRGLQRFVAPCGLGVARALERDLKLLVEPLDFAPARLRFSGAPLCRRRELAAHDRNDDERDQGGPVAGVADAEAGRCDEVAGKGNCRHHRGGKSRQRAEKPRIEQEHQQQHLRSRRPADALANQLKQHNRCADRTDRDDVAADHTVDYRPPVGCAASRAFFMNFGHHRGMRAPAALPRAPQQGRADVATTHSRRVGYGQG